MKTSVFVGYKNHRIANPDWRRIKTAYYTYLSFKSLVRQRYDSLLFLKYGKFKYKVNIINKKYLDKAFKNGGVVFISIHADSYPLAIKIFRDFYKNKKIIVPFYQQYKVSAYKYLKKKFSKHGVHLIRLGGAMKEVDPILSKGGSIVLFLDAALPVNHSVKVNMFGNEVKMSTGPHFLAEKYGLTIVPFCIDRKGKNMNFRLFKPINHKGKNKEKVTQETADIIEKMILMNFKRWQLFDKVTQN